MPQVSSEDVPRDGARAIVLRRARHDKLPCGLCGEVGSMTRTHVPPKAAFNDHTVGRSRLVTRNGIVGPSRTVDGGLHVFGLCAECNGLQSRYDPAYAELATVLRPLWKASPGRYPESSALPEVEVCPGSVSRSILIGMCGVAPHIRDQFPAFAAALRYSTPTVPLPGSLQLRLALCRGRSARVAGPTGGTFLFGERVRGRPIGFVSVAQVYFPPLAWQLASPESTLLDKQRWADVSSWSAADTSLRVPLTQLIDRLPHVIHPMNHPQQSDGWVEMLSDKATEIVESRRLPKSWE